MVTLKLLSFGCIRRCNIAILVQKLIGQCTSLAYEGDDFPKDIYVKIHIKDDTFPLFCQSLLPGRKCRE